MGAGSNHSRRAPSRRQFLRDVAAVAAAGTAGGLLRAPAVHAAGSDALRIGLIGCGGRGSGAVANALTSRPSARLVALGDVFQERLESSHDRLRQQDFAPQVQVASDRKFFGFDAYQGVIASGVDLVILASPPAFHPIHFEAAVKAGKHVFMEKPAAIDAPGARRVLAVAADAKRKGLKIGGGYCYRHDRKYQQMIRSLQEGAIGRLQKLECYYNTGDLWTNPRQPAWSEMEFQLRNWLRFAWLSGDWTVELLTHRLDVANWLMGTHPRSARGTGRKEKLTRPEHGDVFDSFALEYTYPGPVPMTAEVSLKSDPTRVGDWFTGTRGSADMLKGLIVADGQESKARPAPVNMYEAEWADLFDSLDRGTEYCEAPASAETAVTAIMGRIAAYTGREVTWDEALNSTEDFSPASYALDAAPPTSLDKFGNYAVPAKGRKA